MDVTTGHPPYPPTNFPSGSPTVFVNNMQCLTVGKLHTPHGCMPNPPYAFPLSMGSSSVFANSMPISRLGDLVGPECLSTGSGNVIVGG